MRRIMSHVHQGLAWLVMLGWVAELYLIGTAVFGATSTELHRRLGMALIVLVLLLLVVTLVGGLGRRLIGLSALLLVLTIVQGLLPSLRTEIPWLAALHPVNALLLMGVTAAIVRYPRAAALDRTLVASPASTLVVRWPWKEHLMSVRHLHAAATAALLGGLWRVAPAAAHILVQTDPVGAYTLTAGRLWSLVAVLLGLAGAVIGGLVVAAAEGGPGTGYGIVGGFVALMVGLIAIVLGGLALARSRGTGRPADCGEYEPPFGTT